MEPFEFHVPTRILFGPGTECQVGREAQAWGASRLLLVYGGESAVKTGLLDRILKSLRQVPLPYEVLSGVQPNPRLSLVRLGIEKIQRCQGDFVLALGGGSVIDTAKAIALGAAQPQLDLWQDIWLQKVPCTQALPLGVVLTIPAAGSETSASAVLTNELTQEKRGLSCSLIRPKFAILNPELAYTLSPFQLACGIVDIFMHTLERYFHPLSTNELTDALAEALLRTTIQNGTLALQQPGTYQPMSELMWAGSLSHNGLTGLGAAGDFATHQLGHELSAMFDVPHGASLSALWDSWARYCVANHPQRFARMAQQVWGLSPQGRDTLALAQDGIEATRQYFQSLSMPVSLAQLLGEAQPQAVLDHLAYRCSFQNTRTIGHLQVLQMSDMLAIYQMANGA